MSCACVFRERGKESSHRLLRQVCKRLFLKRTHTHTYTLSKGDDLSIAFWLLLLAGFEEENFPTLIFEFRVSILDHVFGCACCLNLSVCRSECCSFLGNVKIFTGLYFSAFLFFLVKNYFKFSSLKHQTIVQICPSLAYFEFTTPHFQKIREKKS